MFGFFMQLNNQDKNAASLLKRATEEKKKDINKAIEFLKQAYLEISKTKIDYPIDTFLRLPLFLQSAGRSQEALDEFNKLLKNGYPNQNRIPELIPMDEAHIYDKMRVFWQREKQPDKAISYGVYSILLDALGLYLQKRFDELNFVKDKNRLIERIIPLLKKAKKADYADLISEIMLKELEKLPNISTFFQINNLISCK